MQMSCQFLKISLPLVESVRLNTFRFSIKTDRPPRTQYYVCDCMDCYIYLEKQNRSTMSLFCNGKM